MDTPEAFGSWLKGERKQRRLTQQALGLLVSYSAAQIRKVEAGERAFSDAQARLLAEYLAVSPDEQDAFVAWARGGTKPEHLSLLAPERPLRERQSRWASETLAREPKTDGDFPATLSLEHVQLKTEPLQRKSSSRIRWTWTLGAIVAIGVVIGLVLIIYRHGDAAASGHIIPGGRWLSPAQNFLVRGDTIHFAALAYPTHAGDPPIAFVNFTVSWLTPTGDWRVACTAATSVAGTPDRYECDWNLTNANVPNGVIKVSFDVYDTKGNVNMAPNGIHEGVMQR